MKTFEAVEKIHSEKVEQMFQLARDVGSANAIWPLNGELRFTTWQDALDFWNLACEQGMDLVVVEADPKPVTLAGTYYRLWPRKK